MKIREAKLAILDTNVFADLASEDAARRKVTTERLDALHKERLLTAVTGTVLTEIAATLGNVRKLKALIDTVTTRVDVFLPFEAGELVKIELAQEDPASIIGDQPLYSTKALTKVFEAVKDPEIEAFFRAGGFQYGRLRNLLPKLDAEIEKLKAEDLPSFSEYVKGSELEHVKAVLELAIASGELNNVDMSPEALKALLARGKSTRMLVLMTLANTYRRAKRWVEKKERTKAAGALSDTRIIVESAYSDVLLTADAEFVACGELVNEVVAEPKIRVWELT